jgi:sugar phosphate isomerase/epimerase
MKKYIHKNIVCAYLYTISKYGYPPPGKDTLKYIDEMHSLGFQSIELEGIREKHLMEVYELKDDISNKLKSLNVSSHFFCIVLPGLSSTDKKIRNKQQSLFEKGCEIARTVGAQSVMDNSPLPPYQFPEDIPVVRHYDDDVLSEAFLPKNIIWSEYWVNLCSTYRECCNIAASYGLKFAVHPAIGLLSSNADAFLNFYDSVDKENLKFTFDTANQFVMKENLAVSLVRLKDYVEYIHLSDNRGFEVEHLEPGSGRISWDVFFDTLNRINYKGFIGIDIGGAESDVDDLDKAYKNTAAFIEKNWFDKQK